MLIHFLWRTSAWRVNNKWWWRHWLTNHCKWDLNPPLLMIDPGTFSTGTTQRVVAESAAMKYNAPRLAHIGGFFYHVVSKRRSVQCPNNVWAASHYLWCCALPPTSCSHLNQTYWVTNVFKYCRGSSNSGNCHHNFVKYWMHATWGSLNYMLIIHLQFELRATHFANTRDIFAIDFNM